MWEMLKLVNLTSLLRLVVRECDKPNATAPTFSHGLTYPDKARLPTRWKRHHWSQYASHEFQQAIRSHKWFFLAWSQVSASC